ncbi:MFS family permease [Aequitasia blattaphilus]|uniref:DUF4203 domain-containing protein n=1 Tax=Aequitasia blattaphilus TaxID=2949332 RepID=A0ABT1E6N0_9FIRM|nr:hypothetical protein [Aequitasia blattaphilus]MCP1101487.1 hypothetical protein [Aequitasia blattaphilus]MCR8614127.1 hypothetical protein [Aequitasia blattaphilus]
MQKIIEDINRLFVDSGVVLVKEGQLILGIAIGLIVASFFICFFGFRIRRLLSIVSGVFVGGFAALVVYALADVTELVMAIIGLGCIVIFAVLAGILERLGIFFMIFIYSFLSLLAVLMPQDITILLICLGASFLLAILAAIFKDPFVIIVTAVAGGLSLGSYGSILLNWQENYFLVYGISIVFIILGMVVQFLSHSKKIAKKQKKRALEVQQEHSRESEVEKAKRLLEDDDDDDDDDIKFVDEE